ncbi:MAG: DUF6110 family protein [Oscillospiraceae bacterium]|jgi:hypothetical protein|nr:DUF6110 family protein [Oscillospiraceae bacterium]
MELGKIKLVVGGALLSTLGYQILRSRDAKKVYSFVTAAVLREKEAIMTELTDIKEDCGDIFADAKARNELYADEKDKIIQDRAAKHEKEPAAE